MYLLNEWAKYFPNDFRELDMVSALGSIEKKLLSIDKSFAQCFTELFTFLAKEINFIEKYEEYLVNLSIESNKKINRSLTEVKF